MSSSTSPKTVDVLPTPFFSPLNRDALKRCITALRSSRYSQGWGFLSYVTTRLTSRNVLERKHSFYGVLAQTYLELQQAGKLSENYPPLRFESGGQYYGQVLTTGYYSCIVAGKPRKESTDLPKPVCDWLGGPFQYRTPLIVRWMPVNNMVTYGNWTFERTADFLETYLLKTKTHISQAAQNIAANAVKA